MLGDFNLDRLGNPLHQAFVSTGLRAPALFDAVPRTIFDNDRVRHFYDQIAWVPDRDKKGELHELLHGLVFNKQAGYVQFIPHVFAGLTNEAVCRRMSDHYPLWVELGVG